MTVIASVATVRDPKVNIQLDFVAPRAQTGRDRFTPLSWPRRPRAFNNTSDQGKSLGDNEFSCPKGLQTSVFSTRSSVLCMPDVAL